MTRADAGRPLTGRKVLAITVTGFGIVVAVNVVMAVKAVSTFPGLEVENSYVASQTFDADRRAQQALGWTVTPEYGADGILSLAIRDRAGLPAEIATLDVTVGRRTEAREDRKVDLVRAGGLYSARLDLAPGGWLLHLVATAPDGTVFRQRHDLMVRG